MSDLNRYNKIFISVFKVKEKDFRREFSINSVDNWDSITQLALVTELEEEFDIMFDTEDILELRSYKIGKTILLKYNIVL